MAKITINENVCKGCELCVVACPSDVLAMSKQANTKGYNYVYMQNESDCIGCAACGRVCPDGCLTIYRAKL